MSHLFWYPGNELLLPAITRAENCSLFDAGGRRWVDLGGGVWCLSIGHGHPRVVRALSTVAPRIAHTGFGYSSPVVEESACEILSLLGFEGGRCVFLCSGSEAVEYGVRIAQQLVGGRPLLIMADAYCGAYGSARSRRDEEWISFDWSGCRDCAPGRECDGTCEAFSRIPFGRLGGFLLEPGSSSGLVRFPPAKLVRAIDRAVREGGGLLLVNEVTTGIGRTGEWFGYRHYGVEPDIVAMGKGIGNGYPVSVAAVSPAVAARLGGEPIAYAQSHQNDPLGAAVAREVVRTIREEGLVERGRRVGARLMEGLQAIGERTGRIADLRGRGPMIAIELAGGDGAGSARDVQHRLLDLGFLAPRRPNLPVLRLDPSLTIDHEDVEAFLAALEAVLAA